MKTVFTIYCGTESDKDGNYIPKQKAHMAVLDIQRQASLLFGGWSMGYVIGGWMDADGGVVKEHSIRLEIVADSLLAGRIKELAMFMRDRLTQSSVMVCQQVVHVDFI